jgi:hypothetical protein
MNVNQFVQVSTWSSILLLIFGVQTRLFQLNGITWFFFGFLCFIGFFSFVLSRPK